MGIREDCKKIVRYFLEKAIEYGSLDMDESGILFSYNSLAEALAFKDGKYCCICFQYLREHGYIATDTKERAADKLGVQRSVRLSSSAIDFLESA